MPRPLDSFDRLCLHGGQPSSPRSLRRRAHSALLRVQNSNNGKARKEGIHGKERDGLTGREACGTGTTRRGEESGAHRLLGRRRGILPPSLFWPSSLSVQHPAWAVTLPRPSVRDPSSALWFGYLVDRLRRSAAAPLRTSPALPHAWDRDQTGRVGRNLSTGETSGGRGRRRPTGRPHHARARGRPTENEDNFTKPTLASPARRSRWYGGQRRRANCICPSWTVLATRLGSLCERTTASGVEIVRIFWVIVEEGKPRLSRSRPLHRDLHALVSRPRWPRSPCHSSLAA